MYVTSATAPGAARLHGRIEHVGSAGAVRLTALAASEFFDLDRWSRADHVGDALTAVGAIAPRPGLSRLSVSSRTNPARGSGGGGALAHSILVGEYTGPPTACGFRVNTVVDQPVRPSLAVILNWAA